MRDGLDRVALLGHGGALPDFMMRLAGEILRKAWRIDEGKGVHRDLGGVVACGSGRRTSVAQIR